MVLHFKPKGNTHTLQALPQATWNKQVYMALWQSEQHIPVPISAATSLEYLQGLGIDRTNSTDIMQYILYISRQERKSRCHLQQSHACINAIRVLLRAGEGDIEQPAAAVWLRAKGNCKSLPRNYLSKDNCSASCTFGPHQRQHHCMFSLVYAMGLEENVVTDPTQGLVSTMWSMSVHASEQGKKCVH